MASKKNYEDTLDEIIKLRSRLDMLNSTLEGLEICDSPPTSEIHILGIENLRKLANVLGTDVTDIYKKNDRCFFVYKGVKVFCLI